MKSSERPIQRIPDIKMNNHKFTRRSFLKAVGAAAFAGPFVTSGLMAQSPGNVLRHASFGASGMAWNDIRQLMQCPNMKLVAVADVDLTKTAQVKEKFPDAKIYQDWRELLDKEARNIDSVNVSTPDHMHAPMMMAAMQLGKHVYGQKPLAHDLYEVRKLTEVARAKKLATQMGIQIHSSNQYRLAVRLLRDGVIGKLKEVHSWVGRSWGDPLPLPDRNDAVPEGLNWDLWLGVCGKRPYIGDAYYHPNSWRRRLDFGTGTLGDMGCHIFDPVFTAAGLGAPISVRSEGPAPNRWNWANDSLVHYVFPGTRYTEGSTLKFTWYDGAQKPPADVLALLEGDEPPRAGSILIGTAGVMAMPHIHWPLLYPDAKFKDFKFPEVPPVSHWETFTNACRGIGRTSAGFDYSGPLTEAVLLGCVASRFPQTTLKWNSAKLEFSERAANQFVRRQYRRGWSVKGL
jgi:predicted dehydrogenase